MKKNTSTVHISVGFFVLCVGIVSVSTLLPSLTFASPKVEVGVSVQTAQLLPPGACDPISVSAFTPYIYDDALHAFEFTLKDSSYVAVLGKAGDTNIPLNLMARRFDSSGYLRIHADTVSIPINKSLPVTVTFMSAKGRGLPVCMSIMEVTLLNTGYSSVTGSISVVSDVRRIGTASAPKTTVAADAPAPPASEARAFTGGFSGENSYSGKQNATGAPATFAITNNTLTALKDICTPKNAPTMWIILLVIYVAVTSYVLFGEPKMPQFIHSQEAIAGAIVVPFLLLFGLWYFAESCRINAWAPAIATIIALVALSVAFWEKPENVQGVINLPSAKV